MSGWLIDFISFTLALVSFYYILPYAKKTLIRVISEYRMRTRIRKTQDQDAGISDEDFGGEESIGLSGKQTDLGKVGAYLATTNKELIDNMKDLLLKAGMRKENALSDFIKLKVNASLLLSVMMLIIVGTNDFGVPPIAVIPVSFIIGVFGGHYLTNMNMEVIAQNRKNQIEHGVPDFVDLLVICTESGLDLNRSIQRISREMRTSNPVLADELSLTAIELEMIPDTRKVFENFENRTDCLEIKAISSTLIQASEYGSSLSNSLRDLAVESRQKRMLNAEAAAARAPTMLTLPMMVFIMPCLFIIMLGPVIIGMIKSFSGNS